MPTAIRLCRSLEEAGQIDWFEEPVPPESFNALAQVREKVDAAISWGERGHTKWDFVPVLENSAWPTTSCPTSPGPAASPS